jgi:hypothetical protein
MHRRLLDVGCEELMERISIKVTPFDVGVDLYYVADPEFYAGFGFSHLIPESDGYFEPVRPLYNARCRASI